MTTQILSAQDTYQVDGKSYELKTVLSGTLTLLWNIIDNQYRYFVKHDSSVLELKNTRGMDNKFQEEYKETLKGLTLNTIDTDNIKLTLPDLKRFINQYNASVDASYEIEDESIKIASRLSFFGGVTNHPYISNPDDTVVPQMGAEIEVFEEDAAPRHSLFLNLISAFRSDDLDYSITQLGIGYRFRFITKDLFNIYANVIVANYSFVKQTIVFEQDNVIQEESLSENGFDVPFNFGFGVDFNVSENSYVTLGWHEIVAAFHESQDNFSTNLTLGYKLNL
jgi:hypothetical protein